MYHRFLTWGLVLSLAGCATQTVPPAVPDEPIILEDWTPSPPPEDLATLRECPSAAVPYSAPRARPRQASLPSPQDAGRLPAALPRSTRTKPLEGDKLIVQAQKAAMVYPNEQGYLPGSAIYRFPYAPGKIYVIYTHPSQFTKLYFPAGLQIATKPTLPEEWKLVDAQVGPAGSEQYVLGVRPTEEKLTADMSLEMRSGQSFALHLLPGPTAMRGVTWSLPHSEEAQEEPRLAQEQAARVRFSPCTATQQMLMPVDLATLHTDYKIEVKGQATFVPTQVFDDGKKTIIKFRGLPGNAPIVRTYKSDGSKGLVQFAPYAVPGDPQRRVFYVVEAIWPALELVGPDGATVTLTRLSTAPGVAVPLQPGDHL